MASRTLKPDREQRMALRAPRVKARLMEFDRLSRHRGQQHAMALMLARGHRLASQRDGANRDWWIAGARRCIETARELR